MLEALHFQYKRIRFFQLSLGISLKQKETFVLESARSRKKLSLGISPKQKKLCPGISPGF